LIFKLSLLGSRNLVQSDGMGQKKRLPLAFRQSSESKISCIMERLGFIRHEDEANSFGRWLSGAAPTW
jgi:hypothetical protein